MSLDGTYGFVYCGANDLGIGMFTIKDGQMTGIDMGGGRYTGTATEDAEGNITVEYSFGVPAGGVLVQGTAPQDIPYTKNVRNTFPPLFGDGNPVPTSSPPVTMMVRKLPENHSLPGKLGLLVGRVPSADSFATGARLKKGTVPGTA